MSRLHISLAFVLCFTTSILADVKPKSNTLTPKEIADGWIMLFDGETTFGWKSSEGAKPKADVKEGMLVISGPGNIIELTTPFSEFELTGEYRTREKGGSVA